MHRRDYLSTVAVVLSTGLFRFEKQTINTTVIVPTEVFEEVSDVELVFENRREQIEADEFVAHPFNIHTVERNLGDTPSLIRLDDTEVEFDETTQVDGESISLTIQSSAA